VGQGLVGRIEARRGDDEFGQSWGYHSRVSVAHRYVCMTIPKVGCTTVKRTLHRFEGLAPLDDWGALHDQGEDLRLSRFGPDDCARMLTAPDWVRFAFVRNPYDRVFSAWKSKLANPWDTQYLWIRDAIRAANDYPPSPDGDRFRPFPAFADYVRFLTETDDRRLLVDGHWNLQTNILCRDLVGYDVIGRFETFVDDFTAVLRRLGAPDEVHALAAQVTNPTPQVPLAAAYDRHLADAIYHHYQPDFEAFAYHRDSWLYA
jgi:hypothetical protein